MTMITLGSKTYPSSRIDTGSPIPVDGGFASKSPDMSVQEWLDFEESDRWMVESFDETFKPIDPGDLAWLRLRDIREIATWNAEMHLDAPLTYLDVTTNLVNDLGITNSEWFEAWTAMNDAYAFLLLLNIDRNRFNPVSPIADPGKSLRFFADIALQDGNLKLDFMLQLTLALHRNGVLPKGPEVGPRTGRRGSDPAPTAVRSCRRDRPRLFRP